MNALAQGNFYKDAGQIEASIVTQTSLIINPVVSLKLFAKEINFDLKNLDSNGETITCVYGKGARDEETGIQYNNIPEVYPLNTSYTVNANNSEYGITIDSGGIIEVYPPIDFDLDNEVIANSKNYFMCYATFLLKGFVNSNSWSLTATREDPIAGEGIDKLYIQSSSCEEPLNRKKGLFPFENHQSLLLAFGEERSCEHFVVLATKVIANTHGSSFTNITYTLVNLESNFNN